jgi:hypothetical protein
MAPEQEPLSRAVLECPAQRAVHGRGTGSGPACLGGEQGLRRGSARDRRRDPGHDVLIEGGGYDVAQGRDGNAMTEDDTGCGDPPDPEVAQHGEQPQDGPGASRG